MTVDSQILEGKNMKGPTSQNPNNTHLAMVSLTAQKKFFGNQVLKVNC
jgi:hypothetical protein